MAKMQDREGRMTCRVRCLAVLSIALVACGGDGATARGEDQAHAEQSAPDARAPHGPHGSDSGSAASARDAASRVSTADAHERDAGSLMPAPDLVDAAAGSTTDEHDHCMNGELVDSRSSGLADKPELWTGANNAVDLVLPKSVLAWMGERVWEPSHDAWHNVRRCKSGGLGGAFGGDTATAICKHAELIAEHQECADAEDGYQFLVMHRHMLRALRQAFPGTPDLFAGFVSFPFNAKDVPEAWQGRFGSGWSSAIKNTATTLESIESKLAMFPSEGDLGKFIQCGGMGSSNGASSIHGALHFKWVVNDSPYSLGKQTVNIDNYMFWKLHGWIDNIWERYRKAKGLTPDEPKLVDALASQCREMHALGHATGKAIATSTAPLPTEHGTFHEQVRPILESVCSGCHSESSPEASLPLGGHISSAEIVNALVNVKTRHGGDLLRVVPGQPDQSWLYLKVAGTAGSAGCAGTMCNTQVMPPTGAVSLSDSQLATIRAWISEGAVAPTTP